MAALALGVASFAVAFCAWRFLLGNENWLEGALVAGVFAGVVVTVFLTFAR
jgi:hypothetical protein